MKKIFHLFLYIGVLLFFVSSDTAFAAKKEKSTAGTLAALSNEGEATVYGSVLNPSADEVNILLSKSLLKNIRKAGTNKLSVTLTSALDSTKTYTVPNDAVSIQRKRINKKAGKYLVISIFNLTSTSGITISPSSLPSGDYKLKIAGKGLNETTDSFKYETPVLIVGTVDSETTGLVSVESLTGDELSERTVATNPNGTFFTEVRAKKINATTKARKHLRAQTAEGIELPDADGDGVSTLTESPDITTGDVSGEEAVEEINTGVVHCVTDTDLYAVTPLNNDPDTNAARAEEPLVVNEETTLTANLAIESAEAGDEDLAFELAQGELEDLIGEGEEEFEDMPPGPPGDIGCAIDQFADRCKGANEDILASIGADFKKFVETAECFFPEFRLIKKIIPKLPDEVNAFIGKGYCEHATREIDNRRPCEIYAGILRDFKAGRMHGELVCPPPQCNEFRDIRPPKCFEPHDFCDKEFEDDFDDDFDDEFDDDFDDDFDGPMFSIARPMPPPPGPGRCIDRPMKDLFCQPIDRNGEGKGIKPEDCTDEDFFGPREFRPGWIIVKNSKGNEYCVPSNIPPPPPPPPGVIDYRPPPTTPQQIAEECELNACHRGCEDKYGFPPGGPGPIIFTPASGPPPPASTEAFYPGDGTGGSISDGIRGGVRGQAFGGFIGSSPPPFGDFIGPNPPPKCEVCDCHFKCDAEAGRVADCGVPQSKYFALKCCEHRGPGGPPPTIFLQTTPVTAGQFFGGPRPPGPPGGRGPISLDSFLRDCLCRSKDNFNEKGYVKSPEVQEACSICPNGYELDPGGSNNCLPTCPSGWFRDPGGNCRKKCPDPRQVVNEFGECSCPQPLVPGPDGKCKEGGGCPDYCKNYPLFRKLLASHDFGSFGGGGYVPPTTGPGYVPPTTGPGYIPPGSSSSLPPECQQCFGGPANCPEGQYYDSGRRICVCNDGSTPGPQGCTGQVSCPRDQYYDQGRRICVCSNDGSIPGPQGCTGVSTACTGGMYPNPQKGPNLAICICPSDKPYWDDGTRQCVAVCPGGNPPPTASANLPIGSPIPCTTGGGQQCPLSTPIRCQDGRCVVTAPECTSGNHCPPKIRVDTGCTCNPSGGPIIDPLTNYCECPANSGPYTKETGCAATTQCPPSTPIKCSDGRCVVNSSDCTSQCPPSTPMRCPDGRCVVTAGECTGTVTCQPPYIPDPAFPGRACKCPDNTPIEHAGGCVAQCPQGLTVGTIPGTANSSTKQVCKCQDGTLPPASGICPTTTQCTGGKIFDTATNVCRCPGNLTDVSGVCQCVAPFIPDPQNPTNNCVCKPPKISGTAPLTCVCPQGQTQDPNNAENCIPATSCTAPKILNTTTNVCECPGGQVQDPNNANNCVCPQGQVLNGPQCCAPCTGGKVFGGATCVCSCPAGQIEGASGNCAPVCNVDQVGTPENPCHCAGTATKDPTTNKCTCTGGQTYSTNGCS